MKKTFSRDEGPFSPTKGSSLRQTLALEKPITAPSQNEGARVLLVSLLSAYSNLIATIRIEHKNNQSTMTKHPSQLIARTLTLIGSLIVAMVLSHILVYRLGLLQRFCGCCDGGDSPRLRTRKEGAIPSASSESPLAVDQGDFVVLTNGTKEWYVKRQTKEEILAQLQHVLEENYLAPDDTGLSLMSALGIGSVLEQEDPQGGRDGKCFNRAYRIWIDETPFSGQTFFDWFDYGAGRSLDIQKCYREQIKRYKKFTADELHQSEMRFDIPSNSGSTVRLVSAVDDTPAKKGIYLYAWGYDKRFYITTEMAIKLPGGGKMKVGHASFFGGKPVLMAGMLEIGDNTGRLVQVDAESGHYQPRLQHVEQFYKWCLAQGVASDSFAWTPLSDEELAASNATRADWDAIFTKTKEE